MKIWIFQFFNLKCENVKISIEFFGFTSFWLSGNEFIASYHLTPIRCSLSIYQISRLFFSLLCPSMYTCPRTSKIPNEIGYVVLPFTETAHN